nr:Bifunctional lycopene cyclase/phytoene synthase [Vector pRS425_YPRCtau3-BTS1-CrtI-CrtYB]
MTALAYYQIHLIYTLPILGLLGLLTSPILTKFDIYKISILVFIAFSATTPWDSWIIRNGAWTYPSAESGQGVFGTFLDVPYEEYAFFVIQTVITGLVYVLATRHLLPSLALPKTRSSALSLALKALIPLPIIYLFTAHPSPSPDPLVTDHYFYMRALSLLITPPTMLLAALSGEYAFDWKSGRAKSTIATIMIPTVYLIWVDYVAVGQDSWSINDEKIVGWRLGGVLPIEEAMFFLLTNLMIVLGLSACDHTQALYLLHGRTIYGNKKMPSSFPLITPPVLSLFFSSRPYSSQPKRDLELAVKLLEKKSRSFFVASAGFPSEVRERLVGLYAFCRVTDDLIDSPEVSSNPHATIDMVSDFLTLLFGPPLHPSQPDKILSSPLLPPSHPSRPTGMYPLPPPPSLSPAELVQFLTERVPVQYHFAFRLLAKLQGLIPRYPLDELLRGYTTDLIFPLSTEAVQARKTPIETTADLLDYGLCVAGSVAELLVYVSWASAPSQVPATIEEREAVLVASREMGTALQLVNIARDIKGDATEGRFYLPLSFFGLRDESKLAIPTDWTEPRPQDFDKLLSLSPSSTLPSSNASESFRFEWKTYSLPLVAYAEDLAKHSYKGIDRLPTEVQAGMRAACASYLLIGREIKVVWKGDVGERRTVAGWRGVRKVLSVVMSGWEGQ